MTTSTQTNLRWVVILVLVGSGSAVSTILAWRWWHTEYVATAEILVRDRRGSPVTQRSLPPPFADDLGLTHMMILQSPAVIDFAVTQGRLRSLASLRDADDVGVRVGEMLTVRRDRTDDAKRDHVVRIECRGPIADDCDAVLTAVIESYEGFLARSYQSYFDTNKRLLEKELNLAEEDARIATQNFQIRVRRSGRNSLANNMCLDYFLERASRRFELAWTACRLAKSSVEIRNEIDEVDESLLRFAAHLREEREFIVNQELIIEKLQHAQDHYFAAQRRLHDLKAWDPANFKVEIRSRSPAAARLSDSH
jgi:hypothetical protein